MKKGNIIFLNGTVNSGKAAIAKALQEIFPDPYLYFSIDAFLHNLIPEKFMSTAKEEISPDKEKILAGIFPEVISTVHYSIYTYASRGLNLIVDHVLLNRVWLDECVELLADFPVLFVGVQCSIDELERRERERQLVEGLVRSQYESVHAHGLYDLEVDTYACRPEICAQVIIKKIDETGVSGNTFRRLREQL